MFYGKIDKSRLTDFLEDFWEMVTFHRWHKDIPSVVGYDPYLPVSFEDAEQHAETFRGDDQLLAYESAQHPELHDKMIYIVEVIIRFNQRHKMWELRESEEYPGISFTFALAFQDKKRLSLHADFLLTIEAGFPLLYAGYDIIKLIKKWGWDTDTYYLLLAYWFSNDKDKEKEAVLEYLSRTGFPVDLKEEADYWYFVEALKQILKKSGFSEEDKRGKYFDLFKELTDKYIIEKTESLKIHYQEIIDGSQVEKPREAKNLQNP